MKIRKLRIGKRSISLSVFFLIVLAGGISASSVNTLLHSSAHTYRPDLITIDSMDTFGKLERPAVPFLHDKHTDTIEKEGKDCKACHKTKDDKLSPMFMRIENSNKQDVMDTYHTNCIGCHNEVIARGKESGPITCAKCHQPEPDTLSSRMPAGMDNSLHYRHTKTLENKCEACHHEYNERTREIYYEKGKEGTCRYCHLTETEKNVRSMELAAHASCIDCHMQKLAEKKITGPIKCSECHDGEAQKMIKKITPVPRMDRKQPGTVMIKTGNEEIDASHKNRMNFVPFNHMAHEEYNDTCRVCHHKAMDTCSKCHTLKGSDEGGGISLELAMHKTGSNQSCTGCHKIKQQAGECAGCHNFIGQNRKNINDDNCLTCHMDMPAGIAGQAIKPEVDADKKDEKIAEQLLGMRNKITGTYDTEDIPEKVIIKELSKKYEPAEFPHRKVVNTIVESIKDNKLAAYFHAEKGTVCQGCHHNSPATSKPTRCISCHGKPFEEKDMFKPGLMGAYHIQCMECHTNMNIAKTGCTDCHKEK